MTQRHVTPAPADQWQVVDPDTDRVCLVTNTKEDAVHRARRALGSSGGGVLVTEGSEGSGHQTETVPPRSQAPRTSFGPAGTASNAAVD